MDIYSKLLPTFARQKTYSETATAEAALSFVAQSCQSVSADHGVLPVPRRIVNFG
jgi:heme/copper-type cytochrome/quinol oxidase subunit 1